MTGHVKSIALIATVCKNILELRPELNDQTSLVTVLCIIPFIYFACKRKTFSACCMLGSIPFLFGISYYVVKLPVVNSLDLIFF